MHSLHFCVVIPIYKANPLDDELFSIKTTVEKMPGIPVFFVAPKKLDISAYASFPSIGILRFPDRYFNSLYGYNRLMLSLSFYRRFRNYKYILIVQPDALILRDRTYLDELLLYDAGYDEQSFFEKDFEYNSLQQKVKSFVTAFYKRKFDIAFQGTEILAGRNAYQQLLLVFESGARWRIGHVGFNSEIIANIFSDVYSQISLHLFAMHETVYMLEMLRKCGLKIERYQPELFLTEKNREKASLLLNNHSFTQETYFIAVGLTGSLPHKNWPEENYCNLFNKIYAEFDDSIIFVLLGNKDVHDEAERLEQQCKNVLNCTGICSLNDTVAVIGKCDLYLGSNTGLLHMAAAARVNAIVLYGECLSDTPYIGGGSV